MMFHVPNQFRVRNARNSMYNSTDADGNNGYFSIKKAVGKPYGIRDKHGNLRKGVQKGQSFRLFLILASDGLGWEHVSISIVGNRKELPAWDEMCYIKDLFWDDTDVVVQYHPSKEEYVNNANVLHMWSPTDVDIPTPPPVLVGLKSLGNLEK